MPGTGSVSPWTRAAAVGDRPDEEEAEGEEDEDVADDKDFAGDEESACDEAGDGDADFAAARDFAGDEDSARAEDFASDEAEDFGDEGFSGDEDFARDEDFDDAGFAEEEDFAAEDLAAEGDLAGGVGDGWTSGATACGAGFASVFVSLPPQEQSKTVPTRAARQHRRECRLRGLKSSNIRSIIPVLTRVPAEKGF